MTETVKDQEKQKNTKLEKHKAAKDEPVEEKESERETSKSGTDKNTEQNSSLLLEQAGVNRNDNVQTIDDFKNLMYKMQETRRAIVVALLNEKDLKKDDIEILKRAYEKLTDNQTHSFQREMCTLTTKFSVNIRDETRGLEKDLKYLEILTRIRGEEPSLSWPVAMSRLDLISILANYHPEGKEKFMKEYENTVRFLHTFIGSNTITGRKPIFITDWDGTMKDYCSQYATNLQPVYSAVGMTRFADCFTRISAVLTAGPLRGPGILDLTAMPIDGPVMFSGSWGREWWLSGKRVVHEDGITDAGFNALQRLDDEMKDLLHSSDYAPFALVGSGVQRKVDRLTLGVQTVCHHVTSELSSKYQTAVKERMHRVDPNSQILVFDPSTELEVEVVVHSSGTIWNKADGVDRLIKSLGDSLSTPGKVLICGDTLSDIPMVRQAAKQNPEGVMAIFVGTKVSLREQVKQVVGDESRCCFVSCPDVIHAAMSQILNEQYERTYIVTYDGYYTTVIRYNILKIAAEITINIEPRPVLLNDFDVVEVSACNSTVFVESLQRSVHIRRVTNNNRFTAALSKKQLLTRRHNSGSTEIRHVTKLLNIDKLWNMGYKGQGVKVAVFDTGLGKHHPHFRQVVERTDWTNEQTADDGLGHGTFVAGLIASSDHKCDGFAPAASIYAYKVFTKKQVSFTSWFLDAFNHAILRGINILNLSIGGPDFTDLPFMDKVWELTANGIILISAIGNDGPKFGTLNNPADQMDVIGVGGINIDSKIARFSSRGMTTWELPGGYGRVKPDIVSYGASVYGSALDGDCRALSGTSVASPVVAGAVAVMLSGIEDKRLWNPAVVKQALIEGATRLPNVATMFEQGAGEMNILASFQFMRRYSPRITKQLRRFRLIPPYIDFNECPYMWPYCSQPVYVSGIPTIINVTIINGMGVSGRIVEEPTWEPLLEENGDLLNVSIMYSDLLWPWSGYMAVAISVMPNGCNYDGTAGGRITVTVVSEERGGQKYSTAVLLIRIRIIPTPPRSQRLLWDQYRNMRYPPGYFPRDDLRDKMNILDWNADHPHTNFKTLYQHLRSSGYYIEILGEPLTCVDLSQYSAYLLIDPEDEFFPSERQRLYDEVNNANLNLIIFADWYNTSVIDKIRFMDENTKQWWQPETGGTNLPALNDLLQKWNISLSARVLDGVATIGHTLVKYLSGTSISSAPPHALIARSNLIDLGAEMITDEKTGQLHEEAIFLYYKNGTLSKASGFVAIFGDSTCLEVGTTSDMKNCVFLLEALLESALEGDLIESLRQSLEPADIALPLKYSLNLPKRMITSNFAKYSKVIINISADAEPKYRQDPKCRILRTATSQPIINVTLSSDLNRHRLKDGRSDFPDENQLSDELTSSQLHEIVQFFDANVGNIERTHPLNLDNRNYSILLWGFIFSIIMMMYCRTMVRRPVVRFRIFRFMLRRLQVL